MGVHSLLKYLRDTNPEILEIIELSLLKGYRLAIDVAVVAYAAKSAYISKVTPKLDLIYMDVDYEDARRYMLVNILKIFLAVLSAGCCPVGIFDGIAPKLKGGTKKDRQLKSVSKMEKIARLRHIGSGLLKDPHNFKLTEDDIKFLRSFPKDITTIDGIRERLKTEINSYIPIDSTDYFLLSTVLAALGVPHVFAECEAEKTCSQMARHKDVIAIYTTDSDCLMYGCPIMINKLIYMQSATIPVPPKAQCYIFSNALAITNLKHTQFIDFCIMCGTDFNKNSPGYGPDKNYELLTTYGSIPKMMKAKSELQEYYKERSLHTKSKNDKLLLEYDFTFLNYDEVRCYITKPISYDKNSLKIKVSGVDLNNSLNTIKNILGEKIATSIMETCKKIFNYLKSVEQTMKH